MSSPRPQSVRPTLWVRLWGPSANCGIYTLIWLTECVANLFELMRRPPGCPSHHVGPSLGFVHASLIYPRVSGPRSWVRPWSLFPMLTQCVICVHQTNIHTTRGDVTTPRVSGPHRGSVSGGRQQSHFLQKILSTKNQDSLRKTNNL